MAMTEDELKAIVAAEIASSVGAQDSEMSGDRIDGWDTYLKQPYGNEVEGRSQVVSSDVQDTVEWIMPSLMRMFGSTESAVQFEPTGQEDEEAAKQATDYANYVWARDNPGFLNFHTWFKEALISKLGTVKVYWEVKDKWKRERYEGLDENTYALVVASPDVEVVEQTENEGMTLAPDGMSEQPTKTYDVVVRMKQSAGRICIDPVPGDEILFSRDAKDVQNCRFWAHRTKKTVSDLIEQHPDMREEIEDLSSDGPTVGMSEAIARSTVNEESNSPYTAAINQAMREIVVTEAYVRVDYDDDGVAEMRKITVAGAGNFVLDNEEWEGPRPFACVCPILMPHRLVGLSIPDLIKDIQLIKTAILRQFLDALYVANNPRQEVVEDLIVDPAEVLTSKPNGIVRVKGNGSVPAIRPIQTTPVADQALLGLNYVDQLRENRTGVSPRTQGLGADTLHDTKGGQELLFDAAKMRVELIARCVAEGVKDAFRLILWNASRYQDKPRTIRLRNNWVPVDPREWADEYDMTVNVGLGHNDQAQKLVAMQMIAGAQAQLVTLQGGSAQGPWIVADNLYNTAVKLVEATGEKTPELFFSDPKSTPAPPPKPNPEMMKVQAELQMKQQEAQLKAQLDQQSAQQKAALEAAQLERQSQVEREQAQADMAVQQQKAQLDMSLAQQKAAVEMAAFKQKHVMEMRAKVMDMRLKAQTANQQAQP